MAIPFTKIGILVIAGLRLLFDWIPISTSIFAKWETFLFIMHILGLDHYDRCAYCYLSFGNNCIRALRAFQPCIIVIINTPIEVFFLVFFWFLYQPIVIHDSGGLLGHIVITWLLLSPIDGREQYQGSIGITISKPIHRCYCERLVAEFAVLLQSWSFDCQLWRDSRKKLLTGSDMMVLFTAIDACFFIPTPGIVHAIVWARKTFAKLYIWVSGHQLLAISSFSPRLVIFSRYMVWFLT